MNYNEIGEKCMLIGCDCNKTQTCEMCKNIPKSYNDKIYTSWEDEFVADIMNRLSPVKFHIDAGFDERLPLELREENRQIAKQSLNYIINKLNNFRRDSND